MNIPFLDLQLQTSLIRKEINDSINNVIDNSSYINGVEVAKFEQVFSNIVGVNYAIGVGNGTDALIIALKALGISYGDEVIVSANTFIATSEAISFTGAKPVFVDVDSETYNIDVNLIESKITKNTKAIIAVHLYGQIAEMNELIRLADKYHLFLIEDAAQAHNAEYKIAGGKWKKAGSLSHIAAFSFYPGKILGAFGDAGAVVTNDNNLAIKARMIANHGRLTKYDHQFEGFNSRLDSIQAAVLNIKLKYLNKWVEKRRLVADTYLRQLSILNQIRLPFYNENQNPSWHLFVILADNRDKLKRFLFENDISTGIHYPIALPFLKAYEHLGCRKEDFPIAYNNQSKLLSLPIYPEMSFEQVDYVCSKIIEFYKH